MVARSNKGNSFRFRDLGIVLKTGVDSVSRLVATAAEHIAVADHAGSRKNRSVRLTQAATCVTSLLHQIRQCASSYFKHMLLIHLFEIGIGEVREDDLYRLSSRGSQLCSQTDDKHFQF